MTFEPTWAHVTLSPVLLIGVTALASLVVAGAAVLITRATASRGAKALSLGVLVFAGIFLPFTLVRAEIRLEDQPVTRGRDVSFCFGEPHWNMLVAAAVPPSVGLLVFLGVGRRKEAEHP